MSNFKSLLKAEISSLSFNTSTTTQEWQQFLQQVAKFNEENSIKISEKIVMFKDQAMKKSWTDAINKEVSTSQQNQEISKEESDFMLKNWSEGVTIASFISNVMQGSGTLAVFTNCLLNAAQLQSLKDGEPVPWHTYVVFYQNGTFGVFDPSFEYSADKLKLKNQKGVALFSHLVSVLRKKGSRFRISSIWFGGGGNNGSQCQEMSRTWIFDEVCMKGGKDLGNWDGRAGWVEIQP